MEILNCYEGKKISLLYFQHLQNQITKNKMTTRPAEFTEGYREIKLIDFLREIDVQIGFELGILSDYVRGRSDLKTPIECKEKLEELLRHIEELGDLRTSVAKFHIDHLICSKAS